MGLDRATVCALLKKIPLYYKSEKYIKVDEPSVALTFKALQLAALTVALLPLYFGDAWALAPDVVNPMESTSIGPGARVFVNALCGRPSGRLGLCWLPSGRLRLCARPLLSRRNRAAPVRSAAERENVISVRERQHVSLRDRYALHRHALENR